ATLSPPQGFRILGADSGDGLGVSVSNAGDVNGDGFADMIIGAAGAAAAGNAQPGAGESYLVFGTASGLVDVEMATLSATQGFRIIGVDSQDLSGFSVSSAGDINGDGLADLFVGARDADTVGNGREAAGESYVVFGQSTGIADVDLAT